MGPWRTPPRQSRPLSRPSGNAGVTQLRGRRWRSSERWRWPPTRGSRTPRRSRPVSPRQHRTIDPDMPTSGGSSRPAFLPSTRSSGRGACRGPQPHPSRATPRAVRPRSPCAWRRPPKRAAGSSPISTWPAAWTPSRPSPAASASSGSSSWHRVRWARPWRWRPLSSRTGRWTCSCSICRPSTLPQGNGAKTSARPDWPIDFIDWPPWPGGRRPGSSSWSRPACPGPSGKPSSSRPACAWNWPGGPGSGLAGTSSGSGRR